MTIGALACKAATVLSDVLDRGASFFAELANGRMQIGPVVITSESRVSQSQIAAFELGREAGPPKADERTRAAAHPRRRLTLV